MPVRFRVSDSLVLAADIEGDWSGHPVLLLHGGGQTRHAWGDTMSALVSEESVNAFRRIVPDAEYVDVQQAGHMVAGDRNDAFTSAVPQP